MPSSLGSGSCNLFFLLETVFQHPSNNLFFLELSQFTLCLTFEARAHRPYLFFSKTYSHFSRFLLLHVA